MIWKYFADQTPYKKIERNVAGWTQLCYIIRAGHFPLCLLFETKHNVNAYDNDNDNDNYNSCNDNDIDMNNNNKIIMHTIDRNWLHFLCYEISVSDE